MVAGPTGALSTQQTGPPGEEPPPDGPSQGVRAGARLLCAQSSPDPSPRKARQRLGSPQPQSPLQGPPRPFVLLQGTGSRWVHLTLCPKGGPVGPAAATAQLIPAECAGEGGESPASHCGSTGPRTHVALVPNVCQTLLSVCDSQQSLL